MHPWGWSFYVLFSLSVGSKQYLWVKTPCASAATLIGLWQMRIISVSVVPGYPNSPYRIKLSEPLMTRAL